MLRRELGILFLVGFLILTSFPTALCRSPAPIIYVAGDGSGDFNCDGIDDHVQINQALKFVAENSGYTTVHIKGPFTYVIDDTLLINSNTILEGDSNAVIKLADHAGWPTMKPLIQQMSNSGNDNITVRGFEVNVNYAGNSEVILGKGYYNVIYFTHSSNVKVYDMYMHDGMGDGLRINQGKNVQFYNNTIYKLGHDGMFAIGCENVEAWNNLITCRTNSALRIWNSNKVKLHDNLIDSFYHWSAGGPGIQIEKSAGIMDNIEIYNNTIHNTYGPGIWFFNYDTSSATRDQEKNIHIHHNIFYSTGTNPSITWVGGVLGSGFHDTLIENNIFDGAYHAAVVHMYPNGYSSDYSPKGGYTTTVRNNIIVNTQKRTKDPSGTGYAVINYLPETHNFVLENNCLYNNVGGNYINANKTTDIYVNPLFADQKNHDYHLQSVAGRWDGIIWVKDRVSSPCIDAGYPSSAYSNEPEPNGNRINIGPDGNTRYASKSELYVSTPILPTANFSSNITSGYAPLSVQFTDLSKNVTGINWNFGDRITSIDQNPTHTYSTAGNYTVNLTVSNANGTDSKTATINVLEKSKPILPVANFSTNITRGSAPLSVQFTDLSQNVTRRNWDFENEGKADSIDVNPVHLYTIPGNYTVNLTVSNENGTDSKFATITVLEKPKALLPIANFSTNVTQGSAPLSIQFTDLSQNTISWSWDFDNNGQPEFSNKNPVYVYTVPGVYTVNLTAINENGTTSKLTTINVTEGSENNSGNSGSTGNDTTSGYSEIVENEVDDSGGSVSGGHSSEGSSSGGSSSGGSSSGGSSSGGSSSGGSSSGGGGGSPEPASNVEVKELSQAFVSSGKPVKFDFPMNATCVVYVGFDAKKNVGKTTTISEMLKEKSTLVSELPEGEVYKSFNVWVGNGGYATSMNIENPVVCFMVKKSWLPDNKIDQSSITLNRYSDKKWEQLSTNLSGEDDKYLYFTAKTHGFSFFAITGKIAVKESGTEIKPKPNTQDFEQKNGSTATNIEQTPAQKGSANTSERGSTKTPGFEIASVIFCLLGVFLYKKDNKK